MIVDRLENMQKYQPLGRRISVALAYLQATDFSQVEIGEHPIEGKDIFAIVNDYALNSETEGQLEAHREYIDIQFLAQGGESIGYVPYREQQMISAYSAEDDCACYAGTSSLIRLEQGMFAIFFPEDLHMPGIGDPDEKVRKVVVKIRRE
jgi:YhcH/YjgK/YiaL family protein